jgi:IS30 family transposase
MSETQQGLPPQFDTPETLPPPVVDERGTTTYVDVEVAAPRGFRPLRMDVRVPRRASGAAPVVLLGVNRWLQRRLGWLGEYGVPGKRLTSEERVRIEVLWGEGCSIPEIAGKLGRNRSTIWRELRQYNSYTLGVKNPRARRDGRTVRAGVAKAGKGGEGRNRAGLYLWGYQATRAHLRAHLRALRPKKPRCGRGTQLRPVVVAKLRERWSPQQIAAWLRLEYPDRPEMQVSHETLYQALYLQSRGNLRAEVATQVALRSGRAQRRPQTQAAGAVRSRRPWATGFHISARPAEAADRAVPGHWEGDLVIGKAGRSAIITLVERTTRFLMLGALPEARTSEEVVPVLTRLIDALPTALRRSLAWDNGNEMAGHARFTVATQCPVYFCDPHSPWQRGSNENTNGLLRQYFPKGKTDFRTLTQADLDAVADELNRRPRETLAWQTPAQALNELLVATAP